jgi:nucleoside-diphosphate-sugar epimerase
MSIPPAIVAPDDPVLVTGAGGFIGARVVRALLDRGFRHVRCFARPAADGGPLDELCRQHQDRARIEIFRGDLQSPRDCREAVRDVVVVYHLAAARGEKSHAEAFRNSVVTTRNLLDALREQRSVRRFVNVSSLSVYANADTPRGSLLDETCPVEPHPERRGDAYTYAKVRQDELVCDYASRFGLPSVILRPGVVYGPGNEAIPGRVGVRMPGVFLHLGGSNTLPLTYVENCADAIVLAGLHAGIDGEIFNIVDDDLPTSRAFLRRYQREVVRLRALRVPPRLGYLMCWLWEWYARRSHGQIPPVFTRKAWHVYWKSTRYSNEKLKTRLAWTPRVPTATALTGHFERCRALAQAER